jgi:hypothetical protein
MQHGHGSRAVAELVAEYRRNAAISQGFLDCGGRANFATKVWISCNGANRRVSGRGAVLPIGNEGGKPAARYGAGGSLGMRKRL